MESQSFAVSDVRQIRILTDSPHVVVKPSTAEQINLRWQTNEYVEFEAQLEAGTLTVHYRRSANWLESLLMSPMTRDDYVLDAELPTSFAGTLDIRTASGNIAVETVPEAQAISLASASGGIDAAELSAREGVEIGSTSGSVRAQGIRAAGDIRVHTVSGSVKLLHLETGESIAVKTTSGGIAAAELSAAQAVTVHSTSGSTDLSQTKAGTDIVVQSVSGSCKVTEVKGNTYSGKTVSGKMVLQLICADAVTLESTSGKITGTLDGTRGEYSVDTHTVSGKNKLGNTDAGRQKSLAVRTVSGGIDIGFAGDAAQ